MSAPSFSSFPPSFSTFPDLDSAQSAASSSAEKKPSSVSRSKSGQKKKEKRKQSSEKNKRRKDREGRDESEYRSKHSKRDRDREREHHNTDEYLKEREDSYRRGTEGLGSANDTLLTVFSDRKGDLLNVKYGGLHAGDIPKYYIVGRKYNVCVHFDMLTVGP